ncbi:M43 family zinc metalloprotease [Sphingobacterium detergens]
MKILIITLFTCLWWSAVEGQYKEDGRIIKVSIVFHVIYVDSVQVNGMSYSVRTSNYGNNTSYIPAEKLIAELNELNEDFQGKTPGINEVAEEYKPVIGSPNFKFELKEVRYKKAIASQIGQFNNVGTLHELSPMISPESCLYIYISKLRVRGRGSEGVTNVPINKNLPEEDCVNLNYSWVGLGYHLLTHEVGHWLGLWHVDDQNQIEITDITDIPVQNRLTDIQCIKCNSTGVKVRRRQRKEFSIPNTNNFMDYSGCRRMFSKQQAAFMRNLIINNRSTIWKNSEVLH